MRNELIKKISDDAAALASAASDFMSYLTSENKEGQIRFDVKRVVLNSDLSFSNCVTRILVVSEVAEKFKQSPHQLLVPLSRINGLINAIQTSQQHLDGLSTQYQNIVNQGGGQSAFNYANFHVQTNKGQNHNLSGQFKNFCDSTENLLEAYIQVLIVLRPSKVAYSFQAAANALNQLIDKTSDEITSLYHTAAKLDTLEKTAEHNLLETQVASTDAIRLKTETETDRELAQQYLTEVTAKANEVDAIHTSATALSKEVNDFDSDFQLFDQKLNTRNREFEKGTEELENLTTQLSEMKSKIGDLIAESEGMLKGATVAGLASSFSEARKELSGQLWWARMSFYAGIVFLFICAIPLMLHVFMPLLSPILKVYFPEFTDLSSSTQGEEQLSGWQYIGQVLARFVILVPAAWFVSFSAVRHSSLFRLREHYAYKYSMAVSVEGFQKQAPGYEDEIAALVLEQLAFNPADKLQSSREIKEAKAPTPLLNVLLGKLRASSASEAND